jgi:Na+/melibiose symporter-like transporter
MPPNPSRLPTSMLIAFGLVNLPLSMLMSPTAGLGHLMTWYLVVTLGWMLIGIPHTAMAAELSHDCHERSRIALWRQLLLPAALSSSPHHEPAYAITRQSE